MKQYIIIGIFIVLVINIIILIIKNSQYKKNTKNIITSEILNLKSQLSEVENQWQQEEKTHILTINKLEEQSNKLEQNYKIQQQRINKEISEAVALRDNYINESKSNWDDIAKAYYENKCADIEHTMELQKIQREQQLLEHYKQMNDELTASYLVKKDEYDKQIADFLMNINKVENTLNEYKAKQDAINEEILRRRAIEENRTFYTVNIDENDKADLIKLLAVKSQLLRPSILDKLIYDAYISRPVNDMIKRVLGNEKHCGIYKITRLNTNEIYIGQSVDINNRWQQHCKSAFDVGTISQSFLHTTMKQDGLFNNFTFELLEEVPKDKLHEREKYWIEHYDTKSYGLNQREG